MLEIYNKNWDKNSDLVDEWFAEAEAKWERAEATKIEEQQQTIDIDDLDSS